MHTIGLYRYNANPDFLAGTAELEGLATFTGAQIAGSKYWLMKVATGVAEGSWLIVDWDAIQQETPAEITNLYGFDGWALTLNLCGRYLVAIPRFGYYPNNRHNAITNRRYKRRLE